MQQLSGARIHRREAIEILALDRTLLAQLVERLERRMVFDLSVNEGHLYVTIGGETLEGFVERHTLVEQT